MTGGPAIPDDHVHERTLTRAARSLRWPVTTTDRSSVATLRLSRAGNVLRAALDMRTQRYSTQGPLQTVGREVIPLIELLSPAADEQFQDGVPLMTEHDSIAAPLSIRQEKWIFTRSLSVLRAMSDPARRGGCEIVLRPVLDDNRLLSLSVYTSVASAHLTTPTPARDLLTAVGLMYLQEPA